MRGDERAIYRGRAKETNVNGDKRFLTGAMASPSAIEVAETCHKIPALLPFWTRCGKVNCRCTTGQRHGPYWLLRWREGSTHRRHYVRASDLDAVRATIERRRRARSAERATFAADLALLHRLGTLRRELEGSLAEAGNER